jgi:hypothetical protein
VNFLLDNLPDVNAVDKNNFTALYYGWWLLEIL